MADDIGNRPADATDSRLAELEARLAAMESKNDQLADYIEIVRLQDLYQHYINTGQKKAIVGLFADRDDVEIELSNKGVLVGRDAPARYFIAKGTPGEITAEVAPRGPGKLIWHEAVNPAIQINKAGTEARAVWLSPGLNTTHVDGEPLAVWQYGKYEIGYVKDKGRWRILTFRWHILFMTPFDKGWVKETIAPNADAYLVKPDRPSAADYYNQYSVDKVNVLTPYPPAPYED